MEDFAHSVLLRMAERATRTLIQVDRTLDARPLCPHDTSDRVQSRARQQVVIAVVAAGSWRARLRTSHHRVAARLAVQRAPQNQPEARPASSASSSAIRPVSAAVAACTSASV